MIDLPDWPPPQSASPYLIDFGSTLRPLLGGPTQKVNRLGNRFGISVVLPPMKAPKTGRVWLSRLIQAQAEGARMRLPLQGFDPGAGPATLATLGIQINGHNQSGTSLLIKGATPNHIFREGQFFSIVSAGRHHLYMVGAESTMNGAGIGTLTLALPLRYPHLGDDRLWFDPPRIEGLVVGDRRQWEWQIAKLVNLEFEIQETH